MGKGETLLLEKMVVVVVAKFYSVQSNERNLERENTLKNNYCLVVL